MQSDNASIDELTKQACREYMARIQQDNWPSFDAYLNYVNSVHQIVIKEDQWDLSTCTCAFWLKYYHCKHVLLVATRLKLTDFEQYAMNAPIERKLKKGRPKGRVGALQLQPMPLFQAQPQPHFASSSVSDTHPVPVARSLIQVQPSFTQVQVRQKRVRGELDESEAPANKRRLLARPEYQSTPIAKTTRSHKKL